MQCIYLKLNDKKRYVCSVEKAILCSSGTPSEPPKPTKLQDSSESSTTSIQTGLPEEEYNPVHDLKNFCLNREFTNCPRIKATTDYYKLVHNKT